MKDYSLAIARFKEAIKLMENLSDSDFEQIWEKISNLNSNQILDKRNWIDITLEFFENKHHRYPRILITKGIDFSTLEYHLSLIREALKNEK